MSVKSTCVDAITSNQNACLDHSDFTRAYAYTHLSATPNYIDFTFTRNFCNTRFALIQRFDARFCFHRTRGRERIRDAR